MWVPLAVAGAGLAGGVLDYLGNQQANAQNWDMFVSNQMFNQNNINAAREYDYNMNNTAYQRARQDMIKAGINPMMMTQQGGAGGGSSPITNAGTGAAAQSPTEGLGKSISGAIPSALSAISAIKNVENLDQDIAYKKLQGVTEAAKAITETETAMNLSADTQKKYAEGLAVIHGLDALKEEGQTRKEKAASERGLIRPEAEARKQKALQDSKNESLKQILDMSFTGTSALKNVTGAGEDIMNSIFPIGRALKGLFKNNSAVGKATDKSLKGMGK